VCAGRKLRKGETGSNVDQKTWGAEVGDYTINTKARKATKGVVGRDPGGGVRGDWGKGSQGEGPSMRRRRLPFH